MQLKFTTDEIERLRNEVSNNRDRTQKAELGQFFTNSKIARFMTQMLTIKEQHIKLLDPGAGIGILSAIFIQSLCKKKKKPLSIDLVAIELDKTIIPFLSKTLEISARLCKEVGIEFTYQIIQTDFLEYGYKILSKKNDIDLFNLVIMNPPYKKISSSSSARQTLSKLGIEVTNLYAGFVAIAKRLLTDSGQLVAITPRSFCNGTYYTKFRYDFLEDMSFRKLHLFESRKEAFCDDDVLQENIIFLAVKNQMKRPITITTSLDGIEPNSRYKLKYTELVHPNDNQKFIRLPKNQTDLNVKTLLNSVSSSLKDLNLQVSIGKVVDFRAKKDLINDCNDTTIPLIYPFNFSNGYVQWPIIKPGKANGIALNNKTIKMLLPRGNYVLIRRFSSKEEPKRIVTAILSKDTVKTEFVGFENHVNYFHINNEGLPIELAKGLAVYLSSSVVDIYFRQFNGHTQVNVGDLKSLPYPSYNQLVQLGSIFSHHFPRQEDIDRSIQRVLGISIESM